MKFENAIKRASLLASKSKDMHDPLTYLRIVPETDHYPALVIGHSGDFGSVCIVDHREGFEVPDICVRADQMLQATRALKKGEWRDFETNGAVYANGVVMDKGKILVSKAGITSLQRNYWPFPDLYHESRFEEFIDFPYALAVVHARADLATSNDLWKCVHFGDGFIETMSEYRQCRAEILTDLKGLLPHEVFSRFPSGDVWVYREDPFCWFKVKDEIRFARCKAGKYPKWDDVVPFLDNDHTVVIEAARLQAAMDSIMSAAKPKHIKLSLTDYELILKAESDLRDYTQAIAINNEGGDCYQWLLDAKHLHQAVKIIEARGVILRYTIPFKPIRLEHGPITEQLNPHLTEDSEI